MAGVKGKSGRKRISKNREQALRSLTLSLPKAIETIIGVSEGTVKDRLRYEAAIEIKDSVIGKPKQQTDLAVKGAMGLMTASEYRGLIEAVAEAKIRIEGQELLKDGHTKGTYTQEEGEKDAV